MNDYHFQIAHKEGFTAFIDGLCVTDNPYDGVSESLSMYWDDGWWDGWYDE